MSRVWLIREKEMLLNSVPSEPAVIAESKTSRKSKHAERKQQLLRVFAKLAEIEKCEDQRSER